MKLWPHRLLKPAFPGIWWACVLLSISGAYAQNKSLVNIGVGGGLSYGGFGVRITFSPFETFGLFGALGYNLDAAGYNLGAQLHLPSSKKISAFATGMYGYNTVLMVEAPTIKSETTYYGFTAGIGIQFTLTRKSLLNGEILLPFRPEVYKTAIDELESIGYEIRHAWPVAFAIGYHILL